jgi:hypothetical protein
MALTDYEELSARSFDEHHDPELRAAVQVCADALAQIDDPRGPLISFEYALADAKDRRRAIELRRAMHAHAKAHAKELFGEGAAPMLAQDRALGCEWRSGMLYGLYIDARHVPARAKLTAGQLVNIVIKAPVARHLRRLRVRVRSEGDVSNVIDMLAKQKRRLPLEELEVGRQVWPSGHQNSQPPRFSELVDSYPNLYYFAFRDAIIPLCATNKVSVADLLLADEPTSAAPRRFLGRALTSGDEKLRAAALQRIAALGPTAGVFSRVLGILLMPRVTEPQIPIIEALRALGPSREHHLLLSKISSRTEQYDELVRKAAGAAAAALRTPAS